MARASLQGWIHGVSGAGNHRAASCGEFTECSATSSNGGSMMPTIAEAHAALTAPGAPVEMEEAVIRGLTDRVWKSTQPDLRVIFDEMRAHGDKDYIVYEDDRLTYAGAVRAAATLAHLLRDKYGVKKGDRVAIAMRNFPEWAIAF